MVCTSLGSLLRPLFYFLCYIHFSLSVLKEVQKLPRVEERPPLRVFHQIVDEEADHVDREEHQRVRN